jgi:(R,R)-butanediol dehydrogenase / meso-butanediol dehydrogenase / diacetyl reductase
MKAIQFNVTIPQYIALKALGAISKSAYYKGPLSALRMVDLPEPKLVSADWVKIKVLRCGVCTSDVNTVLLNNSPAWSSYTSFPSVLGHEFSGRIVEAGAAVDGLAVGDMVTVCPVLNCKARGIEPECEACRKGLACCENFAEGELAPGMALDLCAGTTGGYSEYVVAHKSQVYKVPAGMTPETAALVEPFSIALEAVLSNLPGKDDHVMVIGGGVIGNMVIRAIRALDIPCKVTAAVSSNFTADLSRRVGADTTITGRDLLKEAAQVTGGKCYKPLMGPDSMMCGFDRVYDCFSHSDTVDLAVRSAKTGGVISLVGISNQIKIDPAIMWVKLITLKGTLYYGMHEWKGKSRHVFEIALDLISSKGLDLQSLVSHTFKLEEYQKMMDVNVNKGKYRAIKTMFVMD